MSAFDPVNNLRLRPYGLFGSTDVNDASVSLEFQRSRIVSSKPLFVNDRELMMGDNGDFNYDEVNKVLHVKNLTVEESILVGEGIGAELAGSGSTGLVDETELGTILAAEDAKAYQAADRLDLMKTLHEQAPLAPLANNRVCIDEKHSNRVVDGIITADNVDELRLAAHTDIPSTIATTYKPVQYKNLLVGLSVQLSKPADVSDADYTAIRQQMVNILGFSEHGALGYGWFSEIYVVDQNSQQKLRSRYIAEMTRALSPDNWTLATFSRGPIVSLGDGTFLVTIQNPKTYGLLLFDKNLNGLALRILSSYDITVNGVAGNYSTDKDSVNKQKWWLKADDPKGIICKSWSKADLNGITFTDITDTKNNATVDLFEGQTGADTDKKVTMAYVSSSSLAQYCVFDSSYAFKKMGALNPQVEGLGWYNASGKIVAWAVKKVGNNYSLVPVKEFRTCPDEYVKNDILSEHSFVRHPDTNTPYDHKIYYPLINDHEFKDADNAGVHPQTAGVQNLFVSTNPSKVLIEDVLGSIYEKKVDGDSKTYYKEIKFDGGAGTIYADGQSVIGISDPDTLFYPDESPKFYKVKQADNSYITYTRDGNGDYKNAGVADPNAAARPSRKLITDNRILERAVYSPAYTVAGVDGPYVRAPFTFVDGDVFSDADTYTSDEFTLPFDLAALTLAQKQSLAARFDVLPPLKDADNKDITVDNPSRVKLLLNNNNLSVTVTAGKAKVRIPGILMHSQPLLMTFNYDKHANKHVLDAWSAKMMNFYGAGIYAESSFLVDASGNTHLLTGGSNGNYAPATDDFIPSVYAAQKMITELPSLLEGVSVNELTALGVKKIIDNKSSPGLVVQGPGLFPDFNTAILDASTGAVLLDCSAKGAHNLLALAGVLLGNEVISGETALKVREFMKRNIELRARVKSNRCRRFLHGMAFSVNPKDMSLEYVLRNKYDDIDTFDHEQLHNSVTMQVKDMGYNRDEAFGVCVAGTGAWGSSTNKRAIRMFNKSLINGSNKVVQVATKSRKNQDGSISTNVASPNFALTDEGALGYTGKDANGNYLFGHAAKWHMVCGITTFFGNGYLGNINNKEMFLNTWGSQTLFDQPLPVEAGVSYPGFNTASNIVKSNDEKAYLLKINGYFGQSSKLVSAYYMDSVANDIKFAWIQPLDQSQGMSNGAALTLNDVVIVCNLSTLFVLNAATGAVMKQFTFGAGYGSNSPFDPTSRGAVIETVASGVMASRGCITVATGFNKIFNQQLVGKRLYHLAVPETNVPENKKVKTVRKQALLDKYSELLL